MKACKNCPIYDPIRKTCGNEYMEVNGEILGCLCYMPLKAKIPQSGCWARENGLDMGWQDDLNHLES